jgi:glycosyltransferase involved in cell wall biosynthesis
MAARHVKVCHLTTVHPVWDVRIFKKECKTLADAGYETALVVQHNQNECIEGVKVKGLPKSSRRRSRLTRSLRIGFWIDRHEKAHLYHFHDPELILAGIILKAMGKKVIYDVHEDYPRSLLSDDRTWMPDWSRKVVSSVVSLSEWFGAKIFDGVVAATPAIGKRFPASKTVIVQNYPILNEFINDETVPYKDRFNVMVYVGGLSYLRGIREMVQAMTRLPRDQQCKLLLAGHFDSSAVEDEVKRLRGWEDVEFVGWKSRADIARILGESKMGLVVFHPVPNHTEAQPNKLFEYMSAGIPVIASDFPLWREIVEGNRCGLLVNPLDSEAIADAMAWLLRHPEEAEQMGRNGRRVVYERYNWNAESGKLLEFYERLLA